MQLIANGPDIPDELLDAHEDGRVVFFCGAGISYPAGLPGFHGLVERIYDSVGTIRNELEEANFTREQFDATLDLLERRIPGQRLAVRSALFDVLQPKIRKRGATETHNALLQLGRSRDGALRLVTTNFDRVFEMVAIRQKLAVNSYSAPLLPVPKPSKWDGLVYLHGLLPKDKTNSAELNRLVLTSGDFGLAYLTERWASRFVSELFRNYVVCFVGYSINDPVLRYMMDALAADRMLGEVTPEAYAFGSYEVGEEHKQTIEWQAKGVSPILYAVPDGTRSHAALHDTLKAWAGMHRDGILGKEGIVIKHALARPSESSKQDDFVGRTVWALADKSGLPARRFAEFDPVPSLEWLQVLAEDRFSANHLERFGIRALRGSDRSVAFSLLLRPASFELTNRMSLTVPQSQHTCWDPVMGEIARWLMRHLDAPELLLWFASKGEKLHPQLIYRIERQLKEVHDWESNGDTQKLDELREKSPNAVPRPMLRTLWQVILAGLVKPFHSTSHLYSWRDRFLCEGLTASLRFQLRELLSPRVSLKKRLSWFTSKIGSEGEADNDQLIDWEICLAADHVRPFVQDLERREEWQKCLPVLLSDLEHLLLDALDLSHQLDGAGEESDHSSWYMPSISDHHQNRFHRDWVMLIKLLRDAWLAERSTCPVRAAEIARRWFSLPYVTFKRLALFSASQANCISPEEWLNWILSDDGWYLWLVETKRETSRLLALQSTQLGKLLQEKLESAVLAGPPRRMFRGSIDANDWTTLVDRAVWLRLSKIQESTGELGQAAQLRLEAISQSHPYLKLHELQKEEFSSWMSGTGFPDEEEIEEVNHAPADQAELIEWLRLPATEEDDWSQFCKAHFREASNALVSLTTESIWPIARWRDAFQAWSNNDLQASSWSAIYPVIDQIPDSVLIEIRHSITWWMEKVSRSVDNGLSEFLNLCNRIALIDAEDSSFRNEPVTAAINNPIGHVAQALINLWFKRQPNDNDSLPEDLKPLFTELCTRRNPQFRHARVVFAAHLIALFRVDRQWTEINLLPCFDWDANSDEARSVWEGYLWSGRLYYPLLKSLKRDFLKTVDHIGSFGRDSLNFVPLLTYAAIDRATDFTTADFRTAFSSLPPEFLVDSIKTLIQGIEAAGEQREEYWKNRVLPFWQEIWPKSLQLKTNGISEGLGWLAIAARREFPNALAQVQDWLQPIEHPQFLVHLLHESTIPMSFPEDALKFLSVIIKDQPWAPSELPECLLTVRTASPDLAQDFRFKSLEEYLRKYSS